MSQEHGALPGGGDTHVHFIGVAGIGVSGLARLALARGWRVSGSDLAVTALTEGLAADGARIYRGHAPEHLGDADLVVISAAVREDNPELAAARRRGIPVIKRAEMLGRVLQGRRTVAVAGTHGKTTTSALLTVLLASAGLDPLALVGGEMIDLGGNVRLGAGAYAVAEADEYDASFLRLDPYIAVVTNVEADHLDFYGDVTQLQEAFVSFMNRVPPDGLLVTCADDAMLAALHPRGSAPRLTYSLEGRGDWNATDVVMDGEGTSFRARGPGDQEVHVRVRLFGPHNVANALAGVVVGSHLGLAPEAVAAGLAAFGGTRRRLEYRGGDPRRNIAVYDDYAHHPTEVRVNLMTLRERFSDRRLRCVFQPHTYSRTRDLLHEFAGSFDAADEVILTEIYAARETDTLGMSGAVLYQAVAREHAAARFCPTLGAAVAYLTDTLAPGDVVVTMGAGDVWTVAAEVGRWLG